MRSAAKTSDPSDDIDPETASGVDDTAVDQAAVDPLPAPVAARLGQLAHDLRNPLNSIAMNAELITLVSGDDTPPELDESLVAIERAVEELGARLAALDGYVGDLVAASPRPTSAGTLGGKR